MFTIEPYLLRHSEVNWFSQYMVYLPRNIVILYKYKKTFPIFFNTRALSVHLILQNQKQPHVIIPKLCYANWPDLNLPKVGGGITQWGLRTHGSDPLSTGRGFGKVWDTFGTVGVSESVASWMLSYIILIPTKGEYRKDGQLYCWSIDLTSNFHLSRKCF